MDVIFRTSKLERCYQELSVGEREWGKKTARLYVKRIDGLWQAKSIKDLYDQKALRFHALGGDRKGQYALWIDEFYRLIVTFTDHAMRVVRVEEVSGHYGGH